MRLKNFMMSACMVMAVCCLTLTSCKKETKEEPETTTDDTQDQTTSASDESQVQSEADQAMDDANVTINGIDNTSGKTDGYFPWPCGATIDSTQKASRIITINYNGLTCDSTRSRSGSITVSLSNKWKEAGSVLTLTFNNYKVTRLATGKSITIKGTKTMTNVNGGLLKHLIFNPSLLIVYKAKGSLELTFDDGQVRTWSVARKITYANVSNVLQITLEGDTTIAGVANIVTWGKNRKNVEFKTRITTPIVSNSTCGWRRPTAGVKVHTGLAKEITVTFGVAINGESITSGCAYGYKLNWTNAKGESKQAVLNY